MSLMFYYVILFLILFICIILINRQLINKKAHKDPIKKNTRPIIESKLDTIFKRYKEIPKKIHITWTNKEVINKTQYSLIKNGIHNLKRLNPEYEFRIYTDNEIDEYLQKHLSETDYDLIKRKKMVEKTDLWRLLIIYNEGGIYSDIDRLYNIPLRDVIKPGIKCILPIYFHQDFSHDIMISCPENIFHKTTIDLNLQRRRDGNTNIGELGPITYFNAITKVLLGEEISPSPSDHVWTKIIDEINSCKYIETHIREYPPYRTFLYNGPQVKYDKGELYRSEKVKHWTTS